MVTIGVLLIVDDSMLEIPRDGVCMSESILDFEEVWPAVMAARLEKSVAICCWARWTVGASYGISARSGGVLVTVII